MCLVFGPVFCRFTSATLFLSYLCDSFQWLLFSTYESEINLQFQMIPILFLKTYFPWSWTFYLKEKY